jgi:hypothetical protein
LAKWTIANSFQQTPRNRLSGYSKSPLRAGDGGISTEPDTWKGLEILIDPSRFSWLALKVRAVPVKEIFQSGSGTARHVLPKQLQQPSFPLHLKVSRFVRCEPWRFLELQVCKEFIASHCI